MLPKIAIKGSVTWQPTYKKTVGYAMVSITGNVYKQKGIFELDPILNGLDYPR